MSQITHCLRLRFTAEQYDILTQHDNRLLEAILAVAKPESYKVKQLKTESSDDDDTPIFPEPEPTCPICIDTISNTFTTPCGHNFCGSCMDTLFASSSVEHAMIACPVCRQDVPNPLYEAPAHDPVLSLLGLEPDVIVQPVIHTPQDVRDGGVIPPEYRNTTLMRFNSENACKERIRFLLAHHITTFTQYAFMNGEEILTRMKMLVKNGAYSRYYIRNKITSNRFESIKRHILGYSPRSQLILIELLLVSWHRPNFQNTGLRNFRDLIKRQHPSIWAYEWVLSAPSDDLSHRYFQDRDFRMINGVPSF